MNNRIFNRMQNADAGAAGGGGGDAAAAAASASAAAASGGGDKPWFGDSHKDYVTNKGFKSPDDALTSLQNMEKLLGHEKAGRTVVMPKDEKDVEGIKAFRAKLGVPESADKYELPVPDGDNGEFAKMAASWLHEVGAPKEMGQKLAGKWNEFVAKSVADSKTALAAEMTKQLDGLKTEWGKDFDTNAEQARRFMKASGWDDARVKLYEETFGTADMLKTFSALGKKLGGAEFVKSDGSGGNSATALAAKKQIDDLRAKRIAGQITEKDFHAQMEKLGPLSEAAA